MRKRLTTPVDPPIYYLAVAWLMIAWGGWFCFVFYEHTHGFASFASRLDAVGVEALMFIMLVVMLILLQHKAMHRIVFSQSQIKYIIPFGKKKRFQYQEYPFL